MKKIRVLIAEDHKLIRESWTSMLDMDGRFDVIAACSDTMAAISVARKKRPDVILMDINILPLNGFQATARLSKISPDLKVIALSFHAEMSCVRKMFDSGARGYLTKNTDYTELMEAIVLVHQGSRYVCSEISEEGFEFTADNQIKDFTTAMLTKKELVVSRYIQIGLRTKEIADKLNISGRTVSAHRYNIFKKLKITNSYSLISLLNAAFGFTKSAELEHANNRNEPE
jgi:DNA-binding NarL/FixJ family response regulator